MIADKIAQAFYLVHIKGEAVKSFFDGDFGIQSILISSELFANDLEASSALGELISHISSDPEIDVSNVQEDVSLNPEFFPSIEPIKMTPELEEERDMEIARIKMQHNIPENAVPVVMTKNFDEYGDFVVTRWHIKNDALDITARVGIMPSEFMYLKSITDDDPMLIEHRETSECKKIILQ